MNHRRLPAPRTGRVWLVAPMMVLSMTLPGGDHDGRNSAGESPQSTPHQDDRNPHEDILRWVRDLDDDRFVVRRTATESLIQAGELAVGPVAEAMAGSNLEVATRGIYVLRELAVSRDVNTQDVAVAALERLARSPAKSAARLAIEALAVLGEVRQQARGSGIAGVGGEGHHGGTPVRLRAGAPIARRDRPLLAGNAGRPAAL